jgi:hypothetical protein
MIFERRYLPQALCSLELADNARYGLNTLYLGSIHQVRRKRLPAFLSAHHRRWRSLTTPPTNCAHREVHAAFGQQIFPECSQKCQRLVAGQLEFFQLCSYHKPPCA